ncbi:MAG: helix-turn-helix domain-containing protein, partial [Longimicrobiales bacterium]
VNTLFRDLTAAAGRPLPGPLRGMGRRVLEFPSRYSDLHAMAALSGISRAALKARFRRRDLPSPYTYLRWFRVLAAVHVLEDGELTTEEAAYRVGLHSSGNFCRYVRKVSGCTPTELRQPVGRIRALTAFVEECLGPPELEAWEDLDDLFLARVA